MCRQSCRNQRSELLSSIGTSCRSHHSPGLLFWRKRLQFPSCSAIYSTAQSTANRAPKITPRPKIKKKKTSPKEAAGCGRSSCSELNWRFRGHGPNCVGLLGSGGVSSQLPSCLADHNFLWGLQHSFIPFKSMQKWPLFSRGQLMIHQIRGVKPKPILTLMSKGNFSLFLIFEPDVAFML